MAQTITMDLTPEAPPPQPSPMAAAKGPITFGLIIFLLFFVAFGGWAWQSSLTDGAVAPGMLTTERYIVQHREGGRVLEVFVKEGEHVEKGDLLVALGDASVIANYNAAQHQLWGRLAARSRMLSQLEKQDRIGWDPALIRNRDHPVVSEAMINELAVFNSFRNRFDSQVEVIDQRKAQARQQIKGLEEQIDAATRSIRLIDEEISDVRRLVNKGLERKSRLLGLERQREQLYSSRGANRAAVQQSLDRVSELDATLLNLENDELSQVAQNLSAVVLEIEELRQRLTALADQSSRLDVRAESAGRLLNLAPNVIEGGVVAPGAAIVEIVPNDGELIVEARVQPIDKDSVPASQEGIMQADIMFSGFSSRVSPRMKGTLLSISAAETQDPQNPQITYYRARVRINEGEYERAKEQAAHHGVDDLVLEPGMPAQVVLIAGESSLLDKLIKPLKTSLDSAFLQ